MLNDALKNASGVNVSTGFGIFDYFTVRGLESLTGSLVLTDGVSEPESTFYPLYNVRQIEVLQGQGKSVAAACKEVGTTEQSHYRWRREYGGLSVDCPPSATARHTEWFCERRVSGSS